MTSLVQTIIDARELSSSGDDHGFTGPVHFLDIDDDTDPKEDLPLDYALATRVVGDDPDMGAYEDQ